MAVDRKRLVMLIAAAATLGVVATWSLCPGNRSAVVAARHVGRTARIWPDYRDLVVPPNIAPLNFRIEEQGDTYLVRVRARFGSPIEIFSPTRDIIIPLSSWRRLLAANRGGTLAFDVFVRTAGSQWREYQPIANEISSDPIDSHIAYRRLKPQYKYFQHIGVYQRHLESFDEQVLLHGAAFKNGCVNCHAFLNYEPSQMLLGIRSPEYGALTLLAKRGEVVKIGAPFGHTTWHPSGQVAAFSRYDVRMFYHTSQTESREAVEFDSLLGYYRIDAKSLRTVPAIADKTQLETQPAWSPDGKYLYFASAPKLWGDSQVFPPRQFAEVRYDLRRIRYDVTTDQWGAVETVLSAEKTGKSILTPRLAPDGRFLLFCMCDYGCFALYRPDSDLYLMDMKTRDYRRLECSSEFPDSWHAWSSNGRWIMYSSKWPTGMFTRLYFCHIDPAGRVSKPFVLPQREPGYYDAFVEQYNVPEFITGPVRTPTGHLIKAIRGSDRVEVDAITAPTRPLPEASRQPDRGPE